jgi:GTP-binding protein
LKIINAAFLKSTIQTAQFPKDGRPEFAFAGRSNVGKSTLLNALMGRKGLAKTSSTPGKTQTLNFFDINSQLYFVDLPGYGYAKVPKDLKAQWNRVMLDYLRNRKELCMVAALIDARHKPTELDIQMIDLLDDAEKPTLIVATKIDKLKRGQRAKQMKLIRESLGLDEDALVLPFSGVSGKGVRELWQVIDDILAGPI